MKLLQRLALLLFIIPATLSMSQDIKTKMVSDFTLPDLDNNKVTLSDNFGQGPIYISFWATWCKPCLEEMKIIQGLYEEYSERGFRVFAINTEGARARGKVKSFVRSNGFTSDILIDRDGEVFRRKFKGFALPFSIMTDPQGHVIFSAVGFKPGDEQHIEELIVKYVPGTEDDRGSSGSEKSEE